MNRFLRLRKFYDWSNNCSYPNILLDGSNSTDDYISKPIDDEVLIEVIEKHISRKA